MSEESSPTPLSAGDIVSRYKSGELDFRGLNLDGLKFSSQDLSRANFAGSTFRGASLHAARLNGCDLSGCDFTGANLTSVVAREANFTNAVFANLELLHVDFVSATATRATFEGAVIRSAQMSGIVAVETNFSRARLAPNCVMAGGRFTGASFAEVQFTDSDLDDTDLSKVVFTGSRFENVKFANARFGTKANLDGVIFERCTLTENDLGGSSLRNAKVGATRFRSVNLEGADLRGLEVDDQTSFTMCTFVGAVIERNTLDSLSNHGGLTLGQLRSMKIVDGLAELRGSYSGFWQWLHLIALTVFVWPYLVHLVPLSFSAKPTCKVAADCISVFDSLRVYITTGGTMRNEIAYLMVFVFWFSLTYNLLRFILLAKTKSLEVKANAAGFNPEFSVRDHVWRFGGKVRALRWSHLLWVAKWGFAVNVLLVLYHLRHFMKMYVKW